jgi:hypothetical protein
MSVMLVEESVDVSAGNYGGLHLRASECSALVAVLMA